MSVEKEKKVVTELIEIKHAKHLLNVCFNQPLEGVRAFNLNL